MSEVVQSAFPMPKTPRRPNGAGLHQDNEWLASNANETALYAWREGYCLDHEDVAVNGPRPRNPRIEKMACGKLSCRMVVTHHTCWWCLNDLLTPQELLSIPEQLAESVLTLVPNEPLLWATTGVTQVILRDNNSGRARNGEPIPPARRQRRDELAAEIAALWPPPEGYPLYKLCPPPKRITAKDIARRPTTSAHPLKESARHAELQRAAQSGSHAAPLANVAGASCSGSVSSVSSATMADAAARGTAPEHVTAYCGPAAAGSGSEGSPMPSAPATSNREPALLPATPQPKASTMPYMTPEDLALAQAYAAGATSAQLAAENHVTPRYVASCYARARRDRLVPERPGKRENTTCHLSPEDRTRLCLAYENGVTTAELAKQWKINVRQANGIVGAWTRARKFGEIPETFAAPADVLPAKVAGASCSGSVSSVSSVPPAHQDPAPAEHASSPSPLAEGGRRPPAGDPSVSSVAAVAEAVVAQASCSGSAGSGSEGSPMPSAAAPSYREPALLPATTSPAADHTTTAIAHVMTAAATLKHLATERRRVLDDLRQTLNQLAQEIAQ